MQRDSVIVRPPFPVRLRYRLLGSRVPIEYLPWVEHELSGPAWWLRTRLLGPVLFFAISLSINLRSPRSVFTLVALPVAFFGGYLLSTRTRMRRMYEHDRRRMLAYQRGSGPHPAWGAPFGKQDLYWLATAIAIAFLIVLAAVVFFD